MIADLVAPLAPFVALSGAMPPAAPPPASHPAGPDPATPAARTVAWRRDTRPIDRRHHPARADLASLRARLERETDRALTELSRRRAGITLPGGDPAALARRGARLLASVAELRARIVPPTMTALDRRI